MESLSELLDHNNVSDPESFTLLKICRLVLLTESLKYG